MLAQVETALHIIDSAGVSSMQQAEFNSPGACLWTGPILKLATAGTLLPRVLKRLTSKVSCGSIDAVYLLI